MRHAENHSLRCVASRFSKKNIIQFLCWKIRFYRFLVWKIFFIFFLKIYFEILLPAHLREWFSACLIKFSYKSLERLSRFYVHHQTVLCVLAITFLLTTFMYIEVFRISRFCVKDHRITNTTIGNTLSVLLFITLQFAFEVKPLLGLARVTYPLNISTIHRKQQCVTLQPKLEPRSQAAAEQPKSSTRGEIARRKLFETVE